MADFTLVLGKRRYGAEHMTLDPPLDRIWQPGDGTIVLWSSKRPGAFVHLKEDSHLIEGFVMEPSDHD